jgi:hypothetical protein
MSSIIPNYHLSVFSNNVQTGYYEKQPEMMPFLKIPFELKVEETQRKDIKTHADKLIRGKEKTKTGNWKFYNGLLNTSFPNWYCGNICDFYRGQKKTNLVIFRFSPDHSSLYVFYFTGYDKNNTEQRIKFVNSIIPNLKYVHFL